MCVARLRFNGWLRGFSCWLGACVRTMLSSGHGFTPCRKRQKIRAPSAAEAPRVKRSMGTTDKLPDNHGDLIRRGIQREMPSIDDVHFGLRHVATVGLRFRRIER